MWLMRKLSMQSLNTIPHCIVVATTSFIMTKEKIISQNIREDKDLKYGPCFHSMTACCCWEEQTDFRYLILTPTVLIRLLLQIKILSKQNLCIVSLKVMMTVCGLWRENGSVE